MSSAEFLVNLLKKKGISYYLPVLRRIEYNCVSFSFPRTEPEKTEFFLGVRFRVGRTRFYEVKPKSKRASDTFLKYYYFLMIMRLENVVRNWAMYPSLIEQKSRAEKPGELFAGLGRYALANVAEGLIYGGIAYYATDELANLGIAVGLTIFGRGMQLLYTTLTKCSNK